MNRKIFFLGAIVLLGYYTAAAQVDTIRFMQYNLLTYGNPSNPTSYKDTRLKTIVNYIHPDIISVNEIYRNSSLSQNILDNVLGSNWAKGTYTNTNNEIQTNMLFWRSDKLGFAGQHVISSTLRDIIAFKLFYKDTTASTKDTIFLTVIVAHLKAGSAANDETARGIEAQSVVNYLDDIGKEGNYFMMGDFNVYSDNDKGYRNITQSSSNVSKFYDPLNKPGDWHANNSFAGIHTQSTRTSNLSDGGVSGGLDDRFDFILASNYALNSLMGIKYLQGSYKAIGQDGSHYNKSVNAAPTNTAAPANVIQALYEMSDHLPVCADFVFDPSAFLHVQPQDNMLADNVSVVNPVNSNGLDIHFSSALRGKEVNMELFNLTGESLLKTQLTVENSRYIVEMPHSFVQGVYILRLSSGSNTLFIRLVKL